MKYPFLTDWVDQFRANVRQRCRVMPKGHPRSWINCLGQFIIKSCKGDVPRAERIYRSCLAHNGKDNDGPSITHPKHLSNQVIVWLEKLADCKERTVWAKPLVPLLLKFMSKHDSKCPSTAADWEKALGRLGDKKDHKRIEAVVNWIPGNVYPEYFEPRIKDADDFCYKFDSVQRKMREDSNE